MSASVGDNSGQDVELNLAPIIDCFTVLITYLLVTASFITLSMVDVGVSATGTGSPLTPSGPPPLIATLEIKSSGEIAIKLRGGDLTRDLDISVPPVTAGSWNSEVLRGRLQQIQTKWPELKDMSVSAEPSVIYKDMVNVIQEIKKVLPQVFVSG